MQRRNRLLKSRVIRMHRMSEYFVGGRRLDDAPGVHDIHIFAERGHNAQIVGHEYHGRSQMVWGCLINSRICACTVTSRAVVGSSAIRISGRLIKAIAIITR